MQSEMAQFDPDNIYSSVPKEHVRENKDDDKYKIQVFLEEHPGEWFTSKQIAEETGYRVGQSQTSVRKAITILLELDNIPIISSSYGYKYATNEQEIDEYCIALQHRVSGIVRRIKALRSIRMDVKQ